MPDSRETETQQARELHLLRDERDREVDAQGAGKAGRAVLWASQLLADRQDELVAKLLQFKSASFAPKPEEK